MKTVFLLALLLTSSAYAWEKVVSCDGDMLVIDREMNESGQFSYQTVFRGQLVDSMLEQRLIRLQDLNEYGEIVRESQALAGRLTDVPAIGFQLEKSGKSLGNYDLIFHNRGGMMGDYIFHSCWFKYPQL